MQIIFLVLMQLKMETNILYDVWGRFLDEFLEDVIFTYQWILFVMHQDCKQ